MHPEDLAALPALPLAHLVGSLIAMSAARSGDDVIESVRSTGRGIVGCEGVAVIMRDGDRCVYVAEDAVGPLWKGRSFPMSACVSGWAMQRRSVVIVPDVATDENVVREFYDDTFARSVLMVPIGSGEPLGAIGAYWSQPHEPSMNELTALCALAQGATAAFETVRLLQGLDAARQDAELASKELKHRLKNAYMGAQAVARLELPKSQGDAVAARLAALARAHELLDTGLGRMSHIGLRELVEAEAEAYGAAEDSLRLDGPVIELPVSKAVPFGLIINELATNALKHGALAVANGRIHLDWRRTASGVSLVWQETGGATPNEGAAEGTGSMLLQRLVGGHLRGTLKRSLGAPGARVEIEFDL